MKSRKIGEIFQVNLDKGVVTLQVCEEIIPRGGSPECDGCYFKHMHKEILDNGIIKKVHDGLDCWKFKLNSRAGECWSAYRSDGRQVIFKKIDYENKDSKNSRCDGDNR